MGEFAKRANSVIDGLEKQGITITELALASLLGSGLGAGAGAFTAGSDERKKGALRGAITGLLAGPAYFGGGSRLAFDLASKYPKYSQPLGYTWLAGIPLVDLAAGAAAGKLGSKSASIKKQADEIQPDWKAALTDQQKRLSAYIPSSEEEAQAKAQANLEALKQTMYSLGYQMRARKREEEEPLLQDVGGGMPGREVVIDLPAIKQGWYDPCLRSKQAADQIPGGLADNKPDSDYSKKQIAMGAKVEMEHVNDKDKAREISKDHLEEIPDYYTRLDEMEEEAKSEKRSGVLDEMLAPVGMAGESTLSSIAQAISDRTREGRRVTSDPGTLVSYYPSMAMAAPKAFHRGYIEAEEDADATRSKAIEKELAKAREEYERALSEEYAARGTAKTAGELIDGIAQHHVKCGDGELNQVAGAYLALASLLGYGAHEASRAWVSSRDPRRQKFEAVKEELRRKRMRQPSPILVDIPEPVSADLEAKM